jgi:hypothetical protein
MAVKVLGSALASAFVVLSARSAAADDGTSFRLSWVRGEGAGSCPDAATIASRAAERLGRNPFSETATQSIEGSVVGEGDELKAELRVRDEMGVARGRREIRAKGADCVELADAVVLAVVLAIDPNALLADTPAPAPPSAPPEAPPVAAEPPALDACPVVRCPSPPPCPAARCPPPPLLESIEQRPSAHATTEPLSGEASSRLSVRQSSTQVGTFSRRFIANSSGDTSNRTSRWEVLRRWVVAETQGAERA